MMLAMSVKFCALKKGVEHEDSRSQLGEEWQDGLSVPHLLQQCYLLTRRCCSCSVMLVQKAGHISHARVWRKI